MRLILLFLFLQGLTLSAGFAQPVRPTPEQYYALGMKGEKKNAGAAIEYFMKAAATPASADLRRMAAAKAAHLAFENRLYQSETFALLKAILRETSAEGKADTVMGSIYYSAGLFYTTNYQPDSAILLFAKAKQLFVKAFGPEHLSVGRCYNEMGDIYKYDLYDFEAAEENNEKALAIYEKQRKPDAKSIARIYFSLSAINRSQKDYQKSLAYGLKAIQLIRGLRNDIFLERAYANVANIYSDLHEYDSAERLYERGIRLNFKINHGKDNETLAGHYQGLGRCLKEQKRYTEAKVDITTAIGMYKKLEHFDRILLLNSLQHLAEIDLVQGEMGECIALLKEATALLGAMHRDRSGQAAMLYKDYGDSYWARNMPDSALYCYQQSLIATTYKFSANSYKINPSLSEFALKNYAYEALLLKGNALISLYQGRGNRSDIMLALNCFSLAEKLLTPSRDELDMEDAKWLFVDSNFELYEKSIAAILDLVKKENTDSLNDLAFHYFESSKSKTLSDALEQAVSSDSLMTNDSLLVKLTKYKLNLLTDQDRLRKLEGDVKRDPAKVSSLRNSIVENDKRILAMEERVKSKYPAYLAIREVNKELHIKSVQEIAKERNAVVLEYFWGVENVYAVGISSDAIVFKQIGSAYSLAKRIASFISFFKSHTYSGAPDDVRRYQDDSYKLYEALAEPFSALMKDRDHLIIIPDGVISQIPFETLAQSDQQGNVTYKSIDYMVRHYSIAYMFSSFYLAQPRVNVQSPKMLAFGFTGGLPVRSGEGKSGMEIAGTEEELEALAKKFPNGQFLYGKDVTEFNFKRSAPTADILHLAVHGQGNTEQSYSASLFFRDGDGKEDGELHWYELYGMRLKSILTVLSSCESGIGKAYKGEGMLSMANAFALAGSKNVVMGLWKVDDRVSVALMDDFYKNLKEGKTVDEALTISKREYLERGDDLTANPKIWGALVAYGNQEVIKTNKGSWLIVAAFAVLAALLVAYRKKLFPRLS